MTGALTMAAPIVPGVSQGSDRKPVRATRLPPEDLVARWRELGFWSGQIIPDTMSNATAEQPNARLTIISNDRPAEINLSDFQALAARVARGLSDHGVRRGDVVAVQTPNWLEGMVSFAAVHRLGAVVLPIIHIYGARELGFILDESEASLLISPARLKGQDRTTLIRPAVEAAGLLDRWFLIGADTPNNSGGRPWNDLISPDPITDDVRPMPGDVALLIYTSGTTASPKGVQHTHDTLISYARSGKIERPGLGPGLSPYPIGHIAGFASYMNFVLEGRSCVFLEQWDGAVAARAVDRYKLGSSAGTPLHITDLLDAADRENLDVSSLSDYMAGATTVPGLLVQRCEQAGMRTYRGYGSSEHPVSISGKALDPLEKRLTTEGRPVQGTDVRLLGEDGVDVADGEPGEIAVRGPQQFLGYRDTRLNEKAFTSDGWFLTGDIARRDPDGFYRITDRKKDIIIRAGENISSREVEDHVLAHPAVYEVAAVAEPHARTGERVCVFVVLQPGQGLTVPDLVAWFAARGVARQKTPERIECVDNLPRNAAGKVLKHELRTRLNG